MVSLDPSSLLRAASPNVDLPPQFVTAITVLAESLDIEAGLTRAGRRLVQHRLLRVIRQRHLLEGLEHHQPWPDEPLVLVVVGLPRTGTTLLHNLLAAGLDVDFIPLWEAMEPLASGPAEDPAERRLRARTYLQFVDRLSPTLRAVHPMDVELPEECVVPMQLAGISEWFSFAHRIPRYASWCGRQGRSGAYRLYRRLLLALRPEARVFALKAPSHLGDFTDLLDVFPRARIVWLHRPSCDVLPSFVELVAAARRVTGAVDNPEVLLAEWLPRLRAQVDAAQTWSRDARVMHVQYQHLLADPEAVVRRVAQWADVASRLDAPPARAIADALCVRQANRDRVAFAHLDLRDIELDPSVR